MQGVGPGTVLGGRYALQHRQSQDRDLERWSAHDATLERDVTLTIVASGHPKSAGLLDAARRAAGVEDARLVRILDVGRQNDSSFIVEETMNGSQSLATILVQGPLHAQEARRVAGETAQGLESARQRGLHHLRLTPRHVMIAPDGTIRVSGVAVAAATEGPDEQEPDAPTASRRDTVRLVAVLYAALTGRWPLGDRGSGIEPAPQVTGGVAAPSEIVSGIPTDLDALCRATLNEAGGPMTPGDFASQIAPWPRERVQQAEVEPTAVLGVPAQDGIRPDVSHGVGVTAGVEVDDQGRASTSGTEPTVAISTRELSQKAAAGSATSAAGPQPGSAPASASAATGPRGPSTAQGPGDQMNLGPGLSDEQGPPLPLLPPSTGQPPGRGQTMIVVLVVASFVALALFLGFRGLTRPASSITSAVTPAPKPKAAAAAPKQTPKAVKTEAGPIAILSATGFDPQGDRSESDGKAGRVYDDDTSTSWTSEKYTTADFGNLKKGAGVLLDLGQATSIHAVTLNLGNSQNSPDGPVDVQVYAAPDSSLDGAEVIGEASQASGRIQIKPDHKMPKAQYVIIWFTKLAPDGGQYSASISEIALS